MQRFLEGECDSPQKRCHTASVVGFIFSHTQVASHLLTEYYKMYKIGKVLILVFMKWTNRFLKGSHVCWPFPLQLGVISHQSVFFRGPTVTGAEVER